MQSAKTQHLKQEQLSYAITDDVYGAVPTFRVGGFVTSFGVLKLVVALTLIGVVFGTALLFCVVLLVLVGIVLMHQKSGKQGLGLKHVINQLLTLQRSVLDYSLTLSIAQSEKFQQTDSKKALASMVTSRCKPRKVMMASIVLKEMETLETKLNKMLLKDQLSQVKLGRMNMTPLSTILMKSLMESTEDLFWKKSRANSESKLVLSSRQLLLLDLKLQPIVPAQEKKQGEQEELALAVSKAFIKQESNAIDVVALATKPQSEVNKTAPEASDKEPTEPPVSIEPKTVILAVLPKQNLVTENLKFEQDENVSPSSSAMNPVVPFPAPLSVFPKKMSLVEVALGEPPVEQDLIVTRKVILYSKTSVKSAVVLEEQDFEHAIREEQKVVLPYELLSLKEFPALSPPAQPQLSMSLPPTDNMEPNFLMDIELEPISKPEKTLTSLSSFRLKPVGNDDLRVMLDELEAMNLELDAALARCNALLHEEEKISVVSSQLEVDFTC
ncbi:hypothetical protein PsorP6_001217 [Peronosclerospora sorghi]|uniref:Uncharacterized protein n=1 Tax=Peronosclerospora sorghi TaxID=230839 RepID=A0ACC0WUB4_9STRA|nr:hypothetical protein PsorP6_001217 [Peronosclerospora sorghi]